MQRRPRWYALRHPHGFDEETAECLFAAARVWTATLNAHMREAKHLHPSLIVPEGSLDYMCAPDRGPGIQAHAIAVRVEGGPDTSGWLKSFEDEFPEQLLVGIPPWRRLDLELGRRDTAGFFPEWTWTRLMSAVDAEKLREHPVFRAP